jgi:hypothetical protein
MSPVMTQPMVGVMLNKCVMVDASRSLSWNKIDKVVRGRHLYSWLCTHGNLSLGDDYNSVFSSYRDSSVP